MYLDKERPLDADREREDADLDRDLDNERRDDFALGDLLLNIFNISQGCHIFLLQS